MLASLEAFRFRNLEPLAWSPGDGLHLLLGDNGAGKTSVLEALYLLATTKSFRTTSLADAAAHGSDAFRLAGEIVREDAARVRLELGWSAGQGRVRAVNSKTGSLAEHLGVLPVVAWTAADAEVLTGPPAERRRFLDRGIVGLRPATVDALGRYRRALSQKRELLSGPPGDGGIGAQLAAWNEVLAREAAVVQVERRAYVERLEAALDEVLGWVRGGPAQDAGGKDRDEAAPREAGLDAGRAGSARVTLTYRPSPPGPEKGSGEPEAAEWAPGDIASRRDRVARALERAMPEERRRGRPLVGPHRDDLEVLREGHPLRGIASAGESKALSLALVAAHVRVAAAAGEERRPVVLLDDADAELSRSTLECVWRPFGELVRRGSARQIFATSNRPEVWREMPVTRRWRLVAGGLRAAG